MINIFVQAHAALQHWSELVTSQFKFDNLHLTGKSSESNHATIKAVASLAAQLSDQRELMQEILLKEHELQHNFTLMQEAIA